MAPSSVRSLRGAFAKGGHLSSNRLLRVTLDRRVGNTPVGLASRIGGVVGRLADRRGVSVPDALRTALEPCRRENCS